MELAEISYLFGSIGTQRLLVTLFILWSVEVTHIEDGGMRSVLNGGCLIRFECIENRPINVNKNSDSTSTRRKFLTMKN